MILRNTSIFFRKVQTLIFIGFFIFAYTALQVHAIYYPTDNITNPTCAPGASGCYVSLLPDQTSKSGSLLFSNGTNPSWSDPSALYFDSTNGRLGIGTSSPTNLLSVGNGQLEVRATGSLVSQGFTPILNTHYLPGESAPQSINNGHYNGLGFISYFPNGKYVIVYREGVTMNDGPGIVRMITSTNQGKTWTSPVTIASAAFDLRNVGGGVTPNGRLVVAYWEWHNNSNSRTKYIYSDDEGVTWSTPVNISEDLSTPYGGLIAIGDGKVLLPIYEDDTSGHSYVYISSDNGKTWGSPITVVSDAGTPSYSESSFVYLGGGTILGLVREDYGTVYTQVISTDNGATWTNQGETSFESIASAGPAWLSTYISPSGRRAVVAYYQNRTTSTLKAVYGYAKDLVDGPSGWDVNSKVTLASGSLYLYPSFIHPNESPNGFGWAFNQRTSTNASIDFFITPATTSTPLKTNFTSLGVGLLNISNTNNGQIVFPDGSVMTSAGVGSASVVSNTSTLNITADSGLSGTAYMAFNTGITERMRLTNSGSLGVGTSAPFSKFDVAGNVSLGSYGGVIAAPSNGLIVSGNVGIGTSTPTTKLDVSETLRISAHSQVSPSSGTGIEIFYDSGASDTGMIQSYNRTGGAYKPLTFASSQTMFATGNVGIGDNFSGTPSAPLDIRMANSAASMMHILNGKSSGYSSTLIYAQMTQGDSTSYNLMGLYNNLNTLKFGIRGDGQVTLTSPATSAVSDSTLCISTGGVITKSSAACTASSSIRFKTDIMDYTNSLAKVTALRPVSFTYTEGGKHDIGFIAEEVNQIEPKLVLYEDDGTTPRGLFYDRFTVLLTGALQELNIKVNQQASLDTTLEGSFGYLAKELFNTVDTYIKDLTVGKLKVDGDVCVDDVCISKEQFKQMLIDEQNKTGQVNNVVQENNPEIAPDNQNNNHEPPISPVE